MAMASVLSTITIIIISMIMGLICFYVMSDLPKIQRKKQIEEMTSQLINFVIFIWLGKILLNLTIFIRDPLAILAYPSNSFAFYLAVLFSALLLTYKSIRKKVDVFTLMNSFIPVFLVASFVYEFIQIVWHNNTYSIGYLAWLSVLLIMYLLIRDHVITYTLTIIMLSGWAAGKLVLAIVLPFTTVFGYIMTPWFLVLFFTICFSLLFKQRKQVS